MNYPADFNTPAFPAGKSIAVSRFIAIGSLVVFFFIVCLCGALFWASRSRGINPFLISINSLTGQWTLIGRDGGDNAASTDSAVQESVVVNFTRNWFFISDGMELNDAVWRSCNREECAGGEVAADGGAAAVCCGAGDKLYEFFAESVVPDYATRAGLGERWVVDNDSMLVAAVGKITAAGGTWRVMADIESNVSGRFKILAFVKVVRNTGYYPMTLGYYVADFNAYRI